MKNKIKPSVIVWNSLVALTVGIIAIINLKAAGFLVALLSFISIFVFLELLDIYNNKPFTHYWVVLTPTFWLLAVIGGIIYLGNFIKENIIDVISDKIDNKFSKNN
jgi:hypothetical protein